MSNLVQTAAAAARAYGLDPSVFIAMIQTESGFQADAVSPAGAAGIAQFMGPTWTSVVQQHSELVRMYGANANPNGRFDAVPALYASAAHLSDMLQAAGGDYMQALGGYYAGYGRRSSTDGLMYANLVMGRVSGIPAASSPGPAMTVADRETQQARIAEIVAAAEARYKETREEMLGPLRDIAAGAEEQGVPEAPQRSVATMQAPSAPAAAPTGSQNLRGAQDAEAIQAAVQRAVRLYEVGQLPQAGEVQRAQFGSIVGGLKDMVTSAPARAIGGAIGDVLGPVARPILKAMEWEQDMFGRPVAKAVLFPLKPVLPDKVEGVAEDVLSSILVPSTLLMPQVGRAITVGSLLSRTGIRSLLAPATMSREVALAKTSLRALFPNQARLAAQMHVSTRLVAADPALATRRASVESIERRLRRSRDLLDKLPEGGTKEVKFGTKTVKLDAATMKTRIKKLEADLAKRREAAGADHRMQLESIVDSTDPSVVAQVDTSVAAMKTVARYNPSRLTFWRKHTTTFDSELESSLRWLNDVDPPVGLTDPEDIANWRSSLDWVSNLAAEGPYDPKLLPNTAFNFMARGAEPLRHIPIFGDAMAGALNPFVKGVGAFFQPLSSWSDAAAAKVIVGSRYKQAAIQASKMRQSSLELAVSAQHGAKGLRGEQVLKAAYGGPTPESLADDAIKRYFERQKKLGVTFEDEAGVGGAMKERLTAAFARDIGTVEGAFRNPARYNLDPESLNLFRFMDEALTADRDAGYELGLSVGTVNAPYLPQRRVAGESLQLGTGGRTSFPRAFRERKIKDWDDFIAAAAIDGQQVEHDITKLLDWRLSHMADKKAFQVMTRMMSQDPETQRFVNRPLLDRIKGPIDTTSDEFREAIELGLRRDMDAETASSVADVLIRDMPKKLPILEAERFMGREFSLVPASKFSDKADQGMARRFDAYFRGMGTVQPDEGFAVNTLEFMRSLLLSADLSPVGFVQGARVFAQDPVAYVRMLASGAAWQMTKHGRQVWAVQNAPSMRFAVSKGLQLGHPLDISKKVMKDLPILGPMNREMMDMLGVGKLHIFNTTYASLLMAQKNPEILGLIRQLPHVEAAIKGKPQWRTMTGDDLAQTVAEGINNYVGPVEIATITEAGRFSALERMAVLTPSWTRANIGMILNAPKFGAKGVMARHLFMNQIALQTTMATKLSLALSGQMPSFDPTSTDFLAVKAPTFRFSLMPSMAVVRVPFRVLAGRPEKERRNDDNLLKAAAQELSRFFEGRMAQGPRIMADLLQGEDFLGRKIENDAWYVMKEALPILGQEIAETMDEGNIAPGEVAQRTALEAFGAQVLPKSPFQLYRERVEILTGKPFDLVSRVERSRLELAHEELRGLKERQREYRARRGDAMDQFFNIVDESSQQANKQVADAVEARSGEPGFLAEYAAISAQSLAYRGQESEMAMKTLFEDEAEFEAELRKKPGLARDEIAREYWSLDPDNFTFGDRQWQLGQAVFSDDPDLYRDQLWKAYRQKRQEILTTRSEEHGLPIADVTTYVRVDWPSVRWRDPEASKLEVRRVAAQGALDEIFTTSPYRFIDGSLMSDDELTRLRELRVLAEQALAPMRSIYRAAGQDLPSGYRRATLLSVAQQAANPGDEKLMMWQVLWEQEAYRQLLRNPERDLALIRNPEAIKFYPDRVRFLLSARLLDTPLGNDPEIVRIITEASAR